VDELFGIVNVPMGVWIDEDGTIVRPPEVAYVGRMDLSRLKIPEGMDPYLAAVLEEAKKIRVDRDVYVNALREWVATGAHALSPEQVVQRSRPRPREAAEAAAHFELGQHLYRAGHHDDAIPHFREAHRLQPDNWTYKRQAWQFAHPFQGPTDLYDGDWLADVRKIGAENYYEPLKL
jgi:tetratricopeptide (TPR) repeat protein